MGEKTIEILEDLISRKDEEISRLEQKIRDLDDTIRGSKNGWLAHRKLETSDITANLPVPRLEFFWSPRDPDDWSEYCVEYRLVKTHLLGYLIVVPLGSTLVRQGSSQSVFGRNGYLDHVNLPFRDGAHAYHDAAHMGLPLYAITDTRAILIDPKTNGPDQANRGIKHRKGNSMGVENSWSMQGETGFLSYTLPDNRVVTIGSSPSGNPPGVTGMATASPSRWLQVNGGDWHLIRDRQTTLHDILDLAKDASWVDEIVKENSEE